MRFRFVLSHSIEGDLEITEPGGWQECVLKLERDESFHSLLEYFEGSFIFYGSNGVVNGGIQFIKNIERTYGVDETIEIAIDITFDEISFSPVFTGQFKFSELEEMMNNKMRLPIIRDNFWSKFIARKDTPVDLQAETDLDGIAISSPVEKVKTILTSQKVRALYQGENKDVPLAFNVAERWDIPGNQFGIIDFPITIRDEIEEKFTYPIVDSPTRPFGLFELVYSGVYEIEFAMSVWSIIEFSAAPAATQFEFSINNNTPIIMTRTDIGTPGIDQRTEFTYSDTLDLAAGDELRFFIRNTSGSLITVLQPKISLYRSYLDITADTVFPETKGESFLIHDAATAILKSYGLNAGNPFYSELLGSSLTRARQYEADGCAWTYTELKGLQLRQYSLIEKPFFQSFTQWWAGINPILNLGLGYDSIPSTDPVVLPDTLPDLEDWGVFTGFSAEPMLWTTGTPTAICFVSNGVSVGGFSDIVHPNGMIFTPGKTYKYGYTFTVHVDPPTVTEDVEIHIQAYNAGLVAIDEKVEFYVADNGSTIQPAGEWEFVAPVGMIHLGVIAVYPNGSTAAGLVTINTFVDLLGPDLENTDAVIRVEEKSYFYSDEISIYFSNVRQITRKYDNDRIFNKVSIGYSRWQAEDVSGIDDPQSRKTYSTRLQKVGKNIDLHSEFIGASLAIETTRRTTRKKSADYKYDNEVFIIAIDPTEVIESPDELPDLVHFLPELDENFVSITNLLNSDARYNLKITAGRNFLRWQNYVQGGLQTYIGSVFKFTSAEGNYDMTSEMVDSSPDCLNEDFSGELFSEKGDVPVTDDFIHLADLYEAEIPMEWEEYEVIRDNRRKAIGISLTDVDHVPMFIKTLEYKPVKGTCTLLLWAKEYLDLYVTPDTTPMQECMPLASECEDALTDIDGNILTNELGICITA